MRASMSIGFTIITAALLSAGASERCLPAGELLLDDMGTPDDDLARVAEVGFAVAPAPRLIRRGGARSETVCEEGAFPWPTGIAIERGGAAEAERGTLGVHALPMRLASVWNSRYPSGGNDELLWAGRGVAQQLSAGVALRYGPISAAVAPSASWSENRAFQLVPTGLDGNLAFRNAFYHGDRGDIDLPQRFGPGSFASWSPGQSYLRADAWNVALGISTENLWFGPGIRNSILMSNAGPGFPHVFVGTSQPADIWIGKAEAFLFWGRLERTRFVESAGHPLIQGLVVSYEPRWVPGLYVGLARTMLQPWDGLSFRDYFSMFQTFEKKSLQSRFAIGNNPLDNQMASVFMRWAFPQVGFEVYAEWAREDHNWTWWSTLREPDHTQAYLLGLQKVFRAGSRLVRVHAELTHLQEIRPPDSDTGMLTYYVHGNDLGYTNDGQLLGAWIGPGADSQTLAFDVFHRGGRIGGYVERVRRNDAYYWEFIEPAQGSFSHDVEVAIGARQLFTVGPVQVSWDASAAYRQNRDFLRHEKNLRLALGLAVPLSLPR